jgi:hypothetical protein
MPAGKIGFLCGPKLIAAPEALEIVRVDVAAPEPGRIAAGEKEQLNPLGIPPQESEMGLLNDPDCGTAVTVKFPDCPDGILIEMGDALKDTVDEVPVAPHAGE